MALGDKTELKPTLPLDSLPPVSFTQLFRYSTRLELFIDAVGLVAAFAAGAAQPLMTLLLGNLVQAFISFSIVEEAYSQNTGNETSVQELNLAAAQLRTDAASNALSLTYIGIGMLCSTYIYMVLWMYTGELNAKRIREKYLQAVLRQDIAYFDTVGAGEITTHIQTDTCLVQRSMSEKTALVVNFIAAFLTGFILAYARCWRLALAVSAILPGIGISGAIIDILTQKYIRISLEYIAEGGTLAEVVISNIRTTHAFSTQKTLSNLYDRRTQPARIAGAKAAIVAGVGVGCFMFFMYSAYALAFQFGTTLINEGYANAGQVVNVLLAILTGSVSLSMAVPEMQAVIHGRSAAAKLFVTIERIPDIDSSDPGGFKPDKVEGKITLEDVKFHYPSRPGVPTLKGINVTFEAGQTAALVGASGSGKSTIISLIERFYDPSSGSVKLDGVDIRDLNIKWLRSQIGLVSQEPTLFASTIRANVAHGLINTPYEHFSEEERFRLIKDACIKANADDFISRLPNGYDTVVGESGFLLSGGQKQRVAIARAIVSNPRILLLDEATSALDTQSERIVQDALDRAAAGRTTIVVAHRLSTIKDASCIYVMGEGLVVEQGPHSKLLADENGAYSRLVRTQKLREVKETYGNMPSAGVSDEGSTEGEIQLDRKETIQSIASDLTQKRHKETEQQDVNNRKYNLFYIFARIGLLNREGLWGYAVGTVFAIVSGMAYPVMSIIYGQALLGFSQSDPSVRQFDGNRNALWFFIIAVVAGLAAGFQVYFFSLSAVNLASKLRSLNFKAILRQDVEYFDKDENSTGSLTANLSDNPQKVNGLAGITLATIVQAMATLIGGLIIGLIYAYKIALVGLACIPALVSTGFVRLYAVALKDERNERAYEDSAQLACEAAASIRTVASLTREEDCLRLYSECLEEPLRKANSTAVWTNLLYALSQSMSFYIIALVFWYGSVLVSDLELSMTSFFVALMGTIFGAIETAFIFSFVQDISSARSAGAAIIDLIDSIPEIDSESTSGNTFEGMEVRGQIQFENVHFRYPTRPGVHVLRGLSLKVEPGTYIALVGASGCGKSTVIQLVERFYDVLSGRILFDGRPINEFNVQKYREQIALVSQEPSLYAGTIRFNILLGATKPECEVTQEEIEGACRDASILDFIQSLPDGFDTQVGGKGSQLSGGQKQRIAIARALLRNPKVLLLDEATSALDSNSEKIVQAALDLAAKGRTTIAIAHRLSTIQNADCIYFIKEGRVSEAGNHDELLSLHGDYYDYVHLQALA